MSERRRRWSPESSRRRRKAKRDSREQLVLDEASVAADSRSMAPATESTFTSSYSYAYPGPPQSQVPSSSFQYQTAQLPDQQPLPGAPGGPITMRSNDDIRNSAPMPMQGPPRGYDREHDRRQTRRSRHGSPSSSDAMSLSSSSSSSSYLDISRWYPSYGRSGGVLNAFFKTPSERRQRARRRRSLKKKNRGIFGFGNNSSSSSVNSDMAYGMGFVKKPKSRNFSPRGERAAGLERSDGRPAQAQRRQTDEEILEIGRKLAKVARDSNREDLRTMGKKPPSQFSAAQDTWDKYSRKTGAGYAASSRGIAPSKHGRHSSSSSDDEWESASEGEYSSDESNSGLAYGAAVDLGRSSPPKSSVSRHSTLISARPPEDIRPPDRKSSAVDPRLFGPVNSLRGLINTPCGYGDRNSVYTIPGPPEQRYAGSAGTAESASIEARPLQAVYPVQTSDPSRMDAARASGSFVSTLSREPSHSSRRPDPIPIQAPKPIAPVPTSMYDEQRIRDSEKTEPRESRIRPSENKTFAETALVGAGVAALGAAIMAGRDKGKGKEKERDPEPRHGRHEKYGHDDHREDETVVQDSRRAKELALEKEIERLERALSERNKAREQRKRDSKRDTGGAEQPESRVTDVDAERDYEKRRRNRDSRYSEPDYGYERPETSRRVPDDAFRTRDSPLRAASPVIIDVTPAPSPPLEEADRKSRRQSFEDELRDAKHIYDESMHSTAPISAVDMAAAIAATERARHRDEPERGRTLTKTQDLVQENANAYYHARRMAEREVSSRSRSKSDERSVVEKYDKDRDHESQGAEIVRIVTPPEMAQKPQKHKYSEPNADFRFDHLMSPKDLDHFRPQEYLVRDPSAERPRPYLNLVIPTPVPTPTPESQKKKPDSSRSPEPVVEEPVREEVPDVVISSRGEVVEAPQTPSSKRVSWGPSETQQYEVESPDRSLERDSRSYERQRSPSRSSGWGATAAAVAGIAAAAALSKDDEPERSGRDKRARESTSTKSSEGSRSPPSRKVLPKGTAPSRVLDDEPEDVPPAPGPKPASPRNSQMPGAFADDLDFAATLAAGLQDTGFDPNIVIEDAAYRRRDSPPGSNEHTGVYMQPYSETVTDLGVIDVENGPRPARESGYVIGELADTPASEKGSAFDMTESSSHRKSRSEKTRSIGDDSIEGVQDQGEESPKLSKKAQRKLEKAARSAKLAEEEDRASQPAEAGDDDWEDASTSRKSKRSSKKSKRTSLGWDDADTPVNDRRVSVPVDAFDDLDDTKPVDTAWEEPQRTSKSKRDSKGYDLAEDPSDRRERRREERRRSDMYEPLERDVSSVVSDTRHDDRSNGRGRDHHDDERSVVSAPDGKRDSKSDKRSSKEDKRSSGGFWGLLKGSNGVDGENQSKKDNAGTLGAGAGVAGAVAVSSLVAGSFASRSDAAEAPLEQEETQHVIFDVEHPSERHVDSPSQGIDVFDFQDPEITPRVIKPAIDPQWGDLLPLPPSPIEEQKLDFDVGDDLPSLPDSRPATPPGQEKLLLQEKRDSSQKRPGFATHSRRRSAIDMPLKSPSHTAIPISFRMGQRSSIPASPRVVSNPTSAHQSPAVQSHETFSSPSTKRSPRPPSWDRPTSWESTREIKPLYLIERSAHTDPDGGNQDRDDKAENTPLPPSRESPAPGFEGSDDAEKETRALDSAPLFVDTAVASSAPLGSQEPTPTGLTQTDSGLPDSAREFGTISKDTSGPSHIDSGLPRSAKDVDTPFLEEPHQSPLLESSYATPTGSQSPEIQARPTVQRDESTESVSDFQDALDRPALVEDVDSGRLQDISRRDEEEQRPYVEEATSVDKQDRPGRFSSALSMLPAAGLAGVGALLGRASRGETATSADDHPSQDTEASAAKLIDQPSEISVDPEVERGQAITTGPGELGEQEQAPPTTGDGKSGPDTALDTIADAEVLMPNDSPATHMRAEEALPISQVQLADEAPRDTRELEPEQEAFVIDDTNTTSSLPSNQLSGNDSSTSPIQSSKDRGMIPETPVDTMEWPEQSTSKKKKGKKGKKKQNSIGAVSIPETIESSTRPPSDVQQDTLSQGEPASKATEQPPFLPHDTTTSSDEISQEVTVPGIAENLPKDVEAERPSTPHKILGESRGLTDEPQGLSGADEGPIAQGAIGQSQGQGEESQVRDKPEEEPTAIVDETASAQPELFTSEVQRTGSPTIEDPQRGIEFVESHLQESTQAAVQQTSPVSPARPEEGSAGLASELIDGTPGATGPRSIQDPLAAVEEAFPTPGEPIPQESPPDEPTKDMSGGKSLASDPEHAANDDLQQIVESPLPVSHVEQTEEPSSLASVEESKRDIPSPPPRQTKESSELEQSPSQGLPESESQGTDPILASADDDNAFTVKTSKKNKKKRKSSAIIGDAIQASDTTTPAELESKSEPVESSVEPPTSHQDDVRLKDLSSMVKENPLEHEQQPSSAEFTGLPESSKALEPERVESGLIKSTIPVSEEQDLDESLQSADPTVLPVLDDVPAEIPVPELEKPGHESQEKSAELIDEDEIARREAEADLIREEEAEMSKLQSKKKLKPKEKTRLRQLKANADIRAEEAAAIAETTPPVQPDVSGERSPHSPTQQPVIEQLTSTVAEESIVPKEEATAGLSTLNMESLPTRTIDESEEAVQASLDIVTPSEQVSSQLEEVSGAGPTSGEILFDESTHGEPQTENEVAEAAEDLARREAEAAMIRDEEAELSRLESKKKPNKKDKVRMKVLRSNAERRAQEAESAAQLRIEEQDDAELETPILEAQAGSSSQLQGEDSTREAPGQETREMSTVEPQSFGDVVETSDQISASSHPHIDGSPSAPEGDSPATNVEDSSSIRPQEQELSQAQAAPSSDETTAGTGPSQFEQNLVEQPEHQVRLDSDETASAQIPQILIEDTSSQLDPLPGQDRTVETLQSQSKGDSQPQVEESVSESVEAQPVEGIVDMPEIQIESSSQARDDGPSSEVNEDLIATGVHPEQARRAPSQEPMLVSDIPDTDRATDISSPFGESEQRAVTVTELPQDPESEWPVTTKKSKKKKRKATLSAGSGQTSGTVTPFFDTSEQSPAVESRNLTETVPGGDENVPPPSSFESEVVEQGQQPVDKTVQDLQLEETTANQPLEASVPGQQETSLSTGESIPAQGSSDDNIARDLVEKTTADQPLVTTVEEQPQAEPEQMAFDEEPGFNIVPKKSKKDKKKKRKNTISDDTSLVTGSGPPIANEQPEQSSSLAETSGIFEDEQATTERSPVPLDLTAEPAPITSTIEETISTKLPVPETTKSAEEPLPYQTGSEVPPLSSPTLQETSAGIPEPEKEPEQLTQFGFKEDKEHKDSPSEFVTPTRLPSEPPVTREVDLGITPEPSSRALQPHDPERIASSDFTEAPPMPIEQEEVIHLPESGRLRSASPLEIEAEKPHVEADKANLPGRKSDGWGFLAGAIAGAGVATTLPESREKSSERDAPPEDVAAEHSPVQTVGTDTVAPHAKLSFADVVESASMSGSKDQEQTQATDIGQDQAQGEPFTIGGRGQLDHVSQEPRPVHEDTSDIIIVPEESQGKEPAGVSPDVVDIASHSTLIPSARDIKQEEVLSPNDLVQDPGNFEAVAGDLQSSPQKEQATASEPQPQLDDWTQASSSKKKKKKDKKRKGSSTPWPEAESGAHTPVAEESSEARDFTIDTDERKPNLDTGDLTQPQHSLAQQPEPEPEPEVRAIEERTRAPLAGDEIREQVSLEGALQPETTEFAGDALATPNLHDAGDDHGDTSVPAGSQVLDDLSSGQIRKDETFSSPVLGPKVDDRKEEVLPGTPPRDEGHLSTGQAQESLDREAQEHDELTPKIGSASTEAFATPLQLPAATQDVDSRIAPIDDQPLDLAVTRDSGNDDTEIGPVHGRSPAPEPESSTTVHEITAEPADEPAEQKIEPNAEDLWEPIPKKMSKKEKRKAKKGSLSANLPELTAATSENDSQQVSQGPAPDALDPSSQQQSPILGPEEPLAEDVGKTDLDRSLEPESESLSTELPEEQPSQAREIPVEETPVVSRKMSKKEKRKAKKSSLSAWEDDIAEPIESSQSQTPITVETQVQDIPTTCSPTLDPELGHKEAAQISAFDEPQLEPQISEDTGPSTAKDATAEEEWATPISRKKSKKDKKKKGKQSSSGSVSGNQTPAVVDVPSLQSAEAVESGEPVPEHLDTTTVVPTEDVRGSEDQNDRPSSETIISEPDKKASGYEASDRGIDDTSASQGRKDHRSAELYLPLEGANDQTLIGSSRDASTPSHHSDHRSAEFYVPGGERGLEVQEPTIIEDDWDIPSDDQSKNNNKASSSRTDRTPTLSTPMKEAHHTDRYLDEAPGRDADNSKFLRSPDGRGKELEKMQPSPDLWDDEDYFKPKPADFTEADQESFTKFDIHPAVARGLNTSPDRRVGEERPLVGLGLIHRHSSIFREDEGHVPKLLTMTSDNVSTDSVAIQEMEETPSGGSSQLGALARSATVPARPSSSRSYDEGLSPAVKQVNTKEYFTFETGPAHGANVPLARSVSPDKFNTLRPVSPGLPRSPQFPPPRSPQFSPQLSPQPSPRSPHFPPPSPRSPKYSPRNSSSFEAARDPSKKGSVAALAERFGGAKKATGQEAAATSHGRESTTPGSDNVSEPRSQPDIDAGKFTPQIPDQESREAEIPLESVVVESPVLGSQASVDFPTDEQQPQVTTPREMPDVGLDLPEIREEATLDEFSHEPQVLSEARGGSPDLEDIQSSEEPIPSIETEGDDVPSAGPSVIDFSRPLPGGLPAVQEEPHEEEVESSGHVLAGGPRAVSPDVNRDSGVVTGSPKPPRVHQFESAQQQRDSGVHMREPSGASPRLLGTRAFSPQPARLSHSSIEDEGANVDDKSSKRSSTAESEAQRRFREATPVLEAQDAPVTPEPRKNTSRSRKYPDLGPSPGKKAAAAALAGGGALLAAGATRSRSPSPSPSPSPAASQRSVSDNTDELRASALPRQRRAASSNTGISRSRTPEPLNIRAESPSMLRHSGTPPLRSRRTRSGDLRSLSQLSNRSHSDLGAQASSSPASAVSAANKAPAHLPKTTTPASSDLRRATTPAAVAQGTTTAPTANEGRVRSKDMADVYDGVGEGRLGSPRSPTRPHSMRRRQSMQVLELESRVEQLIAENRALQDARAQAELHTTNRASSTLAERDTEIEALKQSLDFMRKEIQRLTEVNEGLNSAIQQHAVQHDDRYRLLENQHAEATKELLEHRDRHGSYSQTIEEKDEEIKSLREQLEATKEQIREMQKQILATKPADSDFLRIKDVDYFDHRCQQLCSHVQQWVLRFSKFSDMRACRLTTELNDEKIIDRLDNAVLDGSNVDHYLNDRVRRRDVFMSVTMTMIWEFVFTRYLFGMDREQRQKLKNLEKLLLEVGPPQAVRQWRAVTLTLLSKREPFKDQRDQDTEAVVQAVFQTLSMILPPPSNLEDQIQGQLRKVMREAVDLSIEMRTQRAEYMMLPPLQPDYDANGDLAEPHPFNSALMNERSGDKNATADNEALEAQGAVVRVVLFPLVVKKGDDDGVGDDEIVVCPAQVIVARPRSKSRQSYRAPSSDAGGVSLLRGGSPSTAPNRSNVSMTDAPGMAPGMEGAI